MPSLDCETIVKLCGSKDEIGCHKVVDCPHAYDTDQHEPSADVAERSGYAGWCQNCHPAVLATGNWIADQVSQKIHYKRELCIRTHYTFQP